MNPILWIPLALHSFIFILHNRVQKVIYIMRIVACDELKEPNNLYIDNELNNLQTIATHDRFVQGPEFV